MYWMDGWDWFWMTMMMGIWIVVLVVGIYVAVKLATRPPSTTTEGSSWDPKRV